MLTYLLYVIKHKWFVFLECFKLGIPILGIIHDLSRFYPDEFIPYSLSAKYNKDNKPMEIAVLFKYAWNAHQKRNRHHFEHWISFDYHSHQKVLLPIPDRYKYEMLADWRGAARAQSFARGTAKDWYFQNKDVIQLHPETRTWIEEKFQADGY